MGAKLTFKYDREADILHIDNARPTRSRNLRNSAMMLSHVSILKRRDREPRCSLLFSPPLAKRSV